MHESTSEIADGHARIADGHWRITEPHLLMTMSRCSLSGSHMNVENPRRPSECARLALVPAHRKPSRKQEKLPEPEVQATNQRRHAPLRHVRMPARESTGRIGRRRTTGLDVSMP